MSDELIEILESKEELERLDREKMLATLDRVGRQLEEALEIASRASYPTLEEIHSVVLLGMGGSAIGGDLVRDFLGDDLDLPFEVVRGYQVPHYIDRTTLVLASSYSGETEETLEAVRAAQSREAKVVCLTSGGELERMAERGGLPRYPIPAGLPPRAALPYSFVGLLSILSAFSVVADRSQEIRDSLAWIHDRTQNFGPETGVSDNPAKRLALRIYGSIPVVYGSQGRLYGLAKRWAAQISENAKQLAFSSALPEMNHNEICGWEHPVGAVTTMAPLFLRDHQDHARVQIRTEITRELLAGRVEPVREFWSSGESWCERFWSLLILGDFASIYLAFLNREDPTPVDMIESLKAKLKHY